MRDDMKGFYRSYYKNKEGKTIWLGSTQFQPVHARRAFPCFDEPQFKATFNIIIDHHKSFKAVSNSPIKNSETYGDRITTTFKETPRMSTYLVAFLISDFESNGNETELAVLARPEAKSQTKYSLDVGIKLLSKLEEFTNLTYKSLGNPKMHLAAIPDFSAGAMENWGLLTFRERALLFDEEFSTLSAQESIATVIAHEQAHMWFGDYVTCAWWSYTWLNEGFARYFEYFTTHAVNSDWELEKIFVVKQIQSVFLTDSFTNAHPLTNKNTNSPSEVAQMFDTITYNKGASIIRMIEHMMGKDNFQKSIQAYFKNKNIALGVTTPEDLFDAFKKNWKNKDIDLDVIKKDWTEQPGYPVLTIHLNKDRKSINVTQKRFLLKKNTEENSLTYTVPFTYITNKNLNYENTQPSLYITKDINMKVIDLGGEIDWIIANKLQTGYYRVNYDIDNWRSIRKALNEPNHSKIHEVNRAQIIDDLLSFGRANLIPYDEVLHLLDYITTETHYVPLYAAFNGLSFIANRLPDDKLDSFRKFILAIVHNVYDKLTFDEKPDEKRFDKHNRVQILGWACKYGHEDCIKRSLEAFNKFKNNNGTVPVNIRSVVYCTALREGNVTDFDFLWQKYKNETVATEKNLILGYLGCSKSEEAVTKFLNYTLTSDVRLQDKSTAFSSVYSSNRENVQVFFDYVIDNVENIKNALGNYSDVASLITSVSARLTTEKQKKQLENFYNNNKDKFGNSLKDAINNVEDNLEWIKKHEEKISTYLKQKYDSAVKISFNLFLVLIVSVFIIFSN